MNENEQLVRYKEWRPTPFDTKGLGLPDYQEWLVAPAIFLASDKYESRTGQLWLEQGRRLKPFIEDGTAICVRVNHWSCQWVDIVLIKPGTTAERRARRVLKLKNYVQKHGGEV